MMRGRGWEGFRSGNGASTGGDVVGGVGLEVACEGEGDDTGIVKD